MWRRGRAVGHGERGRLAPTSAAKGTMDKVEGGDTHWLGGKWWAGGGLGRETSLQRGQGQSRASVDGRKGERWVWVLDRKRVNGGGRGADQQVDRGILCIKGSIIADVMLMRPKWTSHVHMFS